MALQPVSMFQHDDNPKHTVNAKKKKAYLHKKTHNDTFSHEFASPGLRPSTL